MTALRAEKKMTPLPGQHLNTAERTGPKGRKLPVGQKQTPKAGLHQAGTPRPAPAGSPAPANNYGQPRLGLSPWAGPARRKPSRAAPERAEPRKATPTARAARARGDHHRTPCPASCWQHEPMRLSNRGADEERSATAAIENDPRSGRTLTRLRPERRPTTKKAGHKARPVTNIGNNNSGRSAATAATPAARNTRRTFLRHKNHPPSGMSSSGSDPQGGPPSAKNASATGA